MVASVAPTGSNAATACWYHGASAQFLGKSCWIRLGCAVLAQSDGRQHQAHVPYRPSSSQGEVTTATCLDPSFNMRVLVPLVAQFHPVTGHFTQCTAAPCLLHVPCWHASCAASKRYTRRSPCCEHRRWLPSGSSGPPHWRFAAQAQQYLNVDSLPGARLAKATANLGEIPARLHRDQWLHRLSSQSKS